MCEYCKPEKKIFNNINPEKYDLGGIRVSILGSNLIAIGHYVIDSVKYGIVEEIPIKYCPMCGKKLEATEEN